MRTSSILFLISLISREIIAANVYNTVKNANTTQGTTANKAPSSSSIPRKTNIGTHPRTTPIKAPVIIPTSSSIPRKTNNGTGPMAEKTGIKKSNKTGYGKATTKAPGTVINLKNWKLTLPSAKEIKQPQLDKFVGNRFFYTKNNSVIFKAPCRGTAKSGFVYPRSELREMLGRKKAKWSAASGTHTLTVEQAVLHLPVRKPEVCIAQIHGARKSIVEIRVKGKTVQAVIFGKRKYMLDPNYKLGNKIKTKILVEKGIIKIFYNDMTKPKIQKVYTKGGNYFKVGAIMQSHKRLRETAKAYSQVQVFSLSVSHA